MRRALMVDKKLTSEEEFQLSNEMLQLFRYIYSIIICRTILFIYSIIIIINFPPNFRKLIAKKFAMGCFLRVLLSLLATLLFMVKISR